MRYSASFPKIFLKITFIFFFSALIPVLCSCGGASEFEENAPKNKPIQNKTIKEFILFGKASCTIPHNKVIGGLYESALKILKREYYGSLLSAHLFMSTYEDVVINELIMANYNTLTKKAADDTADFNHRFFIRALLTDGRLNEYILQSESDLIIFSRHFEVMLDIKWELYDEQEKKVVYSKSELGTYRKADTDVNGYRESVRISFRNFLAESNFVLSFKKHLSEYPDEMR